MSTMQLRPIELIVVTVGRFASTTAFRIIYPLIPFLSNRFDISLQQSASLVAVQTAASLISPIGGRLADRFGERRMMLYAIWAFVIGASCCAIAQDFIWFFAGYLGIGIATAIYVPAGQSYLSARSAYGERARAIGIFEMVWAVSAIIGVAPLMYLINYQQSSDLAYIVLAVLGVASALLLWRLPDTHHANPTSTDTATPFVFNTQVGFLLLFPFLAFGGLDLFFVSQSTWLKDQLAANEAMIGALFVLIGIAELLGSSAVVIFADRIGKRRSVVYGFSMTCICLITMALFGQSWWSVAFFVFVFYAIIEYSIVASFPLMSETVPHARGTMMALMTAAVGIGRIFSSLGSEWVYLQGGLLAVAVVASSACVIGLIALTRSQLTPRH
jgi:DHA1 family inner membrane transport protein